MVILIAKLKIAHHDRNFGTSDDKNNENDKKKTKDRYDLFSIER